MPDTPPPYRIWCSRIFRLILTPFIFPAMLMTSLIDPTVSLRIICEVEWDE